MWIMFNKRPPCACAPPAVAIFWSTPWPKDWSQGRERLIRTDHRKVDTGILNLAWNDWLEHADGKAYAEENEKPGFNELRTILPFALIDKHLLKTKYGQLMETDPVHLFGGRDHDWMNARAIRFNGEKIRVFPDEFNQVTSEEMHRYIAGGSHELVASETDSAADQVIGDLKTGLQHVVYEEALVAGCDHAQAILTALGGDPTEGMEFPPIGWYKCRVEYKAYLCAWNDLEEDEQMWIEENRDQLEDIHLGTLVRVTRLREKVGEDA